jgi:chemotaxis signal transduction protein
VSTNTAEELRAVAAKTLAAPREVLTLRLGGEEYGIDILCVQETRSDERPTRMVSDVVTLTGEQIKPAPEFSGAVNAGHISGIATLGEGERARMLILLDIKQLMACESIGLLEPALQ